MTHLTRRTFTLAPWPWNTLRWVDVPDGLEFTYYVLTTITWNTLAVAATTEDEDRWHRAQAAFEAELRDAQSDLRWDHGVRTRAGFMADSRTVRLRRHDLIPGRRARSRTAFARCAARMHAAEAAYRPIRDEIDARLAATLPASEPEHAPEPERDS